jgi:hypothetical protein
MITPSYYRDCSLFVMKTTTPSTLLYTLKYELCSYLVSMIQNIITAITRPDMFFAEMIKSGENLKIPFLFVAFAGIIGAIYGYEIGTLTGRMFASAGAGMGQIMVLSSVIGAFIGVVVFWLIGAAIFYLISMVFKGNGTYTRTLEFVGYGFIPQIFGSLITLLTAIYYLPMVRVPVLRSFQDPALVQNAVTQLMRDPAMLELTKVSAVIAIIFLLWSANIWIFGLKYARNLTIKNAVIVVLVPVIIYIFYTLFMVFVGFPLPGGY